MNAHQHDPANEIIISTLPSVKSRWLRGDLINRVRRSVGVPVEHVVSDPDAERQPVSAGPTTTLHGGT
jgi:hypothetical protein